MTDVYDESTMVCTGCGVYMDGVHWDDCPEVMKARANLTSLDTQVGGTHYKTMGVQPLEAVYANFGYDGLRASVYVKVLKYLGRNKGDAQKHVEDIEKAIHCLQIQLEKAKEET